MKPLHLLQKLAAYHGIQTSYLDVTGTKQDASPDVIVAILLALEVPVSNEHEMEESLRGAELRKSSLEPVMVAWNGKTPKVAMQFQSHVTRRNVYCHLRLENGETQNWSVWLDSLPDTKLIEHDGRTAVRAKIPLPNVPIGYHELQVETRAGLSKCLLIAAPTSAYSAPELKNSWGAFLPMYAARREQSWGAGNFSDWEQFAKWVSLQGGKVVCSLPLLAAFIDDTKCEPSPYSPASRLFWNEFFLDITAIPEFANSPEAQKLVNSSQFQKRLRDFRKARFVQYLPEMKARRQVLEILARGFFGKQNERRSQFEKFIRSRPQVRDYA